MGVLKNFWNRLAGKQPEPTNSQPSATPRRPQPRPEPEGPTLDPERIVTSAPDLRKNVPEIAENFDATLLFSPDRAATMQSADIVFGYAASNVAVTEAEYNTVARTTLQEAKADVAKADQRLVERAGAINTEIVKAGEMAKTEITKTIAQRVQELFSLREKLRTTRRRLRELTVGITGNPDNQIPRPDHLVDYMLTIGVLALVMAVEFFLNFGLVQFSQNSAMSAGFSIGLALVASFAAAMAAHTTKLFGGHKAAAEECKRYFDRWNGIDQETGLQAHAFKPAPSLRLQQVMAYSIFLGVCLTVLTVRGLIIYTEHRPFSDIAGTAIFVFLVAAYYLGKLHTAEEYPNKTMIQYFEAKDEIERVTEEVATLENIVGAPAINAIVSIYNDTVALAKASLNQYLQAAKAARRRLSRLIGEAKNATAWFVNFYRELVTAIRDAIISRHPTADKEPALTIKDARADALNQLYEQERPAPLVINDLPSGTVPAVEITQNKADLARYTSDQWMQAVAEQERRDAEAKKKATAPIFPPRRLVTPPDWRGTRRPR